MENRGTKFDKGKIRPELLPPDALEGAAQVLSMGAVKYSDRNWEKGLKWSRIIGATLRHLFSFMGGQDLDPESGLPHVDHVLTNALFLASMYRRRKDLDDRN